MTITIEAVIKNLDSKQKELVEKMDELGFTSLGHKGDYIARGRTIFMRSIFDSHGKKIATFTKASLKEVESEIVAKIEKTKQYFIDASEVKLAS